MMAWRFTTPAELRTSRLEPFHTARTADSTDRRNTLFELLGW